MSESPLRFAHLHVHTQYSLLDGSSKIDELVARAKELGMEHLAITDHGVMYGAVNFFEACEKAGVHPVLGCEVYVTKERLKKEGRSDAEYNHLVLLAETQQGYQNLIALVSRGFTEGFYYKPRIDWELLEQYHEGLIALSACLAGVVARPVLDEGYEAALEVAKKYKELFGPEHFYLELQSHGIAEQIKVNQALIRMSKELSLDLVCTNDVHYTYKEDKEAHDVLLCIQTGKKVQDEDRMRYEGDFYLKSPEEMEELFGAIPEALENTVKIAERCHVAFDNKRKLPKFDIPAPYTAEEYLRKLCTEGLYERYPITETDPDAPEAREISERLEYELSTINHMGFTEYFLIVWDFIHYARSKSIMVGPGRGSAAGSLVSYCLHITNIDPLRYGLLFERFLNPERVSMPDIDVDFCYERRQEVLDYVADKYGHDQVTQIVTFGTMKAKQVIRDVGRALDLPYAQCDKISKMIPNDLHITIDDALKVNKELRELYESDPEVQHLIDMSRRLEGLPRHSSTHACGVVISSEPTMHYVPLMTQDGAPNTQFDAPTLEHLGLLKMDFLGLRTLTVIRDTIAMVKQNEGIDINIDEIGFEDPNVYKMIAAGQTDGVFQLESAGMTSFMKELKPESLEDCIAGISLFRPGPMSFIPKYIAGKRRGGAVSYETPLLEPILRPTYGCMVYQEQVMQIVRDLAGYSLGRSDLVRRAMSKKKADVMAKERQNFIYGNEAEGVPGALSRGVSEEAANRIFDEMMDFAQYAFNKSHAACYAVVGYETAWLKYYYPAEFMAATLTSVIDQPKKLIHYLQTVKEMGIELVAPDINNGRDAFAAVPVTDADGTRRKCIFYALSAVKNVGHSVIQTLSEERDANGPFLTLDDFCRRMADTELNKRAIENLIAAGAFDSLGGRRSQYMAAYPQALAAAINWKKVQLSGQMDLFSLGAEEGGGQVDDTPLPNVPEYPDPERLAMEKEALGLYLSGHPLSAYMGLWESTVTADSTMFAGAEDDESGAVAEDDENAQDSLQDGETRIIGGILTGKTIKTTKNANMMAFITLEDLYGSVEVLLFPNTYDEYKSMLETDAKLFVKGKVTKREGEDTKLICDVLTSFETPELLDQMPGRMRFQKKEPPVAKTLWLRVKNADELKAKGADIARILKDDIGDYPVMVYVEDTKERKGPAAARTSATPMTRARLAKILGEENVKLQ